MSISLRNIKLQATIWRVLIFNLIIGFVIHFFLFIFFQFVPQLAQKNAQLFYQTLIINSEFTIAGWVILILTLVFFAGSLIMGYMRINYAFWIGLGGMIFMNLLFYAGNFLLFNNFATI